MQLRVLFSETRLGVLGSGTQSEVLAFDSQLGCSGPIDIQNTPDKNEIIDEKGFWMEIYTQI